MATILIIDDEKPIRFALAAMLAGEGHEVLQAENGSRGIAVLEGCPVDVVISDILMPEKEGLETIIELRRRWPDLPVIAISGGGRTGTANYLYLAAQLGATATLDKPFTRAEMLARLETCL
jgi:DNA-binding NtrC family response regulator